MAAEGMEELRPRDERADDVSEGEACSEEEDDDEEESEESAEGLRVLPQATRRRSHSVIWEEAVRQIQSAGRQTKVLLTSRTPTQKILRVTSLEKEDQPVLQSSKGGTSYAKRLQRCVNLWTLQAICMLLAILHCIAYFLNVEQIEDKGLLSWRVALIWSSLFPLVFINIFEVLVRVSAQGGPLLYLSSWLAFYSLVFHQLEAILVAILAYRFGRSTYLLLLFMKKNETSLSEFNFTTDRITVPLLICYRLYRAYGIFFNINLQSTREQRKQRKREQVWSVDHESHLREHRARIFVRLQEAVNTRVFQLAIILVVVLHCGLYSSSRTEGFLAGYYYFSKFTGYTVCAVFLFEFWVRAAAQGGFEAFFYPFMHRFEAIFAVGGVFMTGYSSYNHFAIAESRAALEPSGVVTAIFLIIHRLIRCLALYIGISGSELDHDSLLEAEGSKIFRQKFDGLLKMPPENLRVMLTSGKLTINVRKAEVCASAFEGLHLPVTVRGGIVEDLYIMIKHTSGRDHVTSVPGRLSRFLKHKSRPMTIVSVKNLLVLFGPGDGLAEAGGAADIGSYWNHDTIRAAKAKLVELIHAHLSPAADQEEGPVAPAPASPAGRRRPSLLSMQSYSSGPEGYPPKHGGRHRESVRQSLRYSARRFFVATKERATSLIKQRCLRHVEVDLVRVTLQLDDLDGRLGLGPVSLGMRFGEASVDADHKKYVQCRLMRLGFFVEHARHGKVGSTLEPLQTLLQEHPEKAKKEMERLDRLGIWRTWAFEELERVLPLSDRLRHKRMEALRDPREVFSISKLHFSAGPLRGELHRQDHLEDLSDLIDQAKDLEEGGCSDRLAESAGLDSEGVPEDVVWKWSVDTTPIRMSMDELQARCVKTVVAYTQAWFIHDNAFRWWPYIRLSDFDLAHHTREERSSTVRLWWIYAIHRVLAMKRLRPRVLWLDVMWRARSYQRYKGLVTQIAWREDVQAQTPLADFARGWEKTHLEELQMHLGLVDIVDVRKKALLIQQKKYLAAPSSWRGQLSRTMSSGRLSGALRGSLHSVGSGGSNHPFYSGMSMESTMSTSSTGSRSSGVGFGATVGHSPGLRRLSFSSEMSRRSLRSQAETNKLLLILRGIWEVCIPAVEARVLRCRPEGNGAGGPENRRPLLIFASATGLCSDGAVGLYEGMALCSATSTVDHIRVRSPEADPLVMGGTRHLFTVMEYLTLPPPVETSMPLPPGRRVGNEVAFAGRWQLNALGNGTCEVHVPDIRVIVYEPLLLVLMTYASIDPLPPISWLEDDPLERRKQFGAKRVGKHSQMLSVDNNGVVTVLSSRQGPLRTAFEVNELDLSAMPECRRKLHWQEGQVRDARKFLESVHNNQRRFELLTGMAGLIGDIEVRLNVGAIHCTQVGEYSRTHVLIEQCRFWPFVSQALRGTGEDYHRSDSQDSLFKEFSPVSPSSPEVATERVSARSPRKIEVNFNGFNEAALVDWEDKRWSAVRVSQAEALPYGMTVTEAVDLEPGASPRSMKDIALLPWFCAPGEGCKAAAFCGAGPITPASSCPAVQEGAEAFSRRLASISPEMMVPDGAEEKGLPRPRATCEVEVRMVPCTTFSGEWLVRESREWHQSVRTEVPRREKSDETFDNMTAEDAGSLIMSDTLPSQLRRGSKGSIMSVHAI